MSGDKLTTTQRQELEQRIWELAAQGWTQERIGAEIGYTQQGVSRILIKLTKRALKTLDDDIAARKITQVRVLDTIIDKSLSEWERSRNTKTKTVTKVSAGRGRGKDETTEETEVLLGDTRYLDEARAAMGDQRKILGMDAPIQAEITENVTIYLPRKLPAPGIDDK